MAVDVEAGDGDEQRSRTDGPRVLGHAANGNPGERGEGRGPGVGRGPGGGRRPGSVVDPRPADQVVCFEPGDEVAQRQRVGWLRRGDQRLDRRLRARHSPRSRPGSSRAIRAVTRPAA